jgi:hypothetical protein
MNAIEIEIGWRLAALVMFLGLLAYAAHIREDGDE